MIGKKIKYQQKFYEDTNEWPSYKQLIGTVVDAYSRMGSDYMPNGSTMNYSNRVYVVEEESGQLVDIDRRDVLFIVK